MLCNIIGLSYSNVKYCRHNSGRDMVICDWFELSEPVLLHKGEQKQ